MLGIFYLAFNVIGLTVGYIKDGMSNDYLRNSSKRLYEEGKNPGHIYIDTQGYSRDITTNHKIYMYRDKNKDLIVKDLKTGIEKNIDKPIREEKYRKEMNEALQRARKNGKIAQFGKFTERQYSKTFLSYQDRYIDIRGNIYIKKYMIWNSKTMELNESDRIGTFYLNIKTYEADYIDVESPGEIFKHCCTCDRPYRRFDMIYANEEESEKYRAWYNQNICKNEENPLRYYGKFCKYDYKK